MTKINQLFIIINFFAMISATLFCGVLSAQSIDTDFSAAMHSLNFNPAELDANGADGAMGNGIPDAAEMALVSHVLKTPGLDFSDAGGTSHQAVSAAYAQALHSARQDLAPLLPTWPRADIVAVGYALLGQDTFNMYNAMSAGFGTPLRSDYSQAIEQGEKLAGHGDADGDGFSNLQEYLAFGPDTAAFVAAALDDNIRPQPSQLTAQQPATQRRKNVGIVLYPGFEVLDVYGPLEMWAYVPDFNLIIIAEEAGPVQSAQGIASIATHTFETAPALDILMVPGGIGTRVQLDNPRLLDYIREADRVTEYTTSVCTGSALLAKAGVLDGHRATTNKRAFYLSEQQSSAVEWIVDARWVESGKMFTSSGVSAGTDMALALIADIHGIDTARALADSLEYTWHEQADVDPFAQYVSRLQAGSTGPVEFVRAEPARDSAITATPGFIRLYFNKLPVAGQSKIKLFAADQTGQEIALQDIHTMGANDLMISVSEHLPAGEYIVEWQTLFDHEEALQGSYRFRISE